MGKCVYIKTLGALEKILLPKKRSQKTPTKTPVSLIMKCISSVYVPFKMFGFFPWFLSVYFYVHKQTHIYLCGSREGGRDGRKGRVLVKWRFTMQTIILTIVCASHKKYQREQGNKQCRHGRKVKLLFLK